MDRPEDHVAQHCDHLPRIARALGFRTWIWLWRANPELAARRRSPFLLFKGDRDSEGDLLAIPPVETKTVRIAAGRRAVFRLNSTPLALRLRVLSSDRLPLAGAPYRLFIDGVETRGRTETDGGIVRRVPDDALMGKLAVLASAEPRIIRVFQLRVGALNPIREEAPGADCLSGVQARLHNLGFDCGPVNGRMNSAVEAAIRAFQAAANLPPTGRSDPEFQDRLHQLHDEFPSGSLAASPLLEDSGPEIEDWEIVEALAATADVAPDAQEGDSFCEGRWNTLVCRSEYRVGLRLGSAAALLASAEGPLSKTARMAGLRALGQFNHAPNAPDAERRLDAVWRAWSAAAGEPGSGGPKADALLRQRLDSGLLSGGRLPGPGEIAHIDLPAGLSAGSTAAGAEPPPGFDVFAEERRVFDSSPVLGRVPLIAKIEKLDASGDWVPASGAAVKFELIPADSGDPILSADIEDFLEPRLSFAGEGALEADPADPQSGSAHVLMGGKRGSPRDDEFFELSGTPGFHAPHPGSNASAPLLSAADAVPAAAPAMRGCAVVVASNPEGLAGVLFRPSTIAGDRYRIRASLASPTRADPFPGERAPAADGASARTGQLILRRTARIGRWFRLDPPDQTSPAVLADLAAAPYGVTAAALKAHEFFAGGPDYLKAEKNPDGTLALTGAQAFREAGLRLVLEAPGGRPERLRDNERLWRLAHDRMMARGRAAAPSPRYPYDLDKLIYFDANSPFLINARSPEAYNKALGPGGGAGPARPMKIGPAGGAGEDDRRRVHELVRRILLPELIECLTDGAIGGTTTLIQAPCSFTWQVLGLAPWREPWTEEGTTLAPGVAALWFGAEIHETRIVGGVGAGLTRRMGSLLGLSSARIGPEAERHSGPCVMTLTHERGGFCGRCAAILMGWDVNAPHFVGPAGDPLDASYP